MTYQIQDDDDCTVTGRIIDVLDAAKEIYENPNRAHKGDGWIDGAIEYIFHGGEWKSAK